MMVATAGAKTEPDLDTSGWLIPHPTRQRQVVDGVVVYCDTNRHNQYPYIWNTRFLHTYCHASQMSPAIGDICLWVSPDPFGSPEHLWCDLVFFVEAKIYWQDANTIQPTDPLIDTPMSYSDHYRWHGDHPYRRRRRYTLKADPVSSFQPQERDGSLIDIQPMVVASGISAEELRSGLRAGFGGKPLRIPGRVAAYISQQLAGAATCLCGSQLEELRHYHQELASHG